MNILLTGGTGFVGKHLIAKLTERNDHIYNVTRTPENHTNTTSITYISYDHSVEQLGTIDAVINLAGESLFGYWTNKKKQAILTSRIETTNKVVNMMKQMNTKPRVFINGSAVGYYGTSAEMIFTEETTEAGDDFLADVVSQWEATAKRAEQYNIRTVYSRFGLILGEEGSLPIMSLPVKMFVGGKIGRGNQWISWIHVQDVVRLLLFCIDNDDVVGPINFTAPRPQRNKEFIKILSRVLKRPFYFPAPAPLMRLGLGEMSELITKGQYVLPKKAEENDYTFSYRKLDDALRDIFNKK